MVFLHSRGGKADETEARGDHETLLRPGQDQIDPPGFRFARHGPQPRNGVHRDQGARLMHHLGQGLDIVDVAGGGLVEGREDQLDAGVGLEPFSHFGGVHRLAPLHLVMFHFHLVGLADFPPAVPEMARGGHEDLLARRSHVGHGGFHDAGAHRGKCQDRLFRPEDELKTLVGFLENRLELGGPVVDDRHTCFRENFGGNGSRPWGHNVTFQHWKPRSAPFGAIKFMRQNFRVGLPQEQPDRHSLLNFFKNLVSLVFDLGESRVFENISRRAFMNALRTYLGRRPLIYNEDLTPFFSECVTHSGTSVKCPQDPGKKYKK